MTVTTLDPNQTDLSDITLSNGNLTALGTGFGAFEQYQYTAAQNPISGQCYWETFWNEWGAISAGTAIGLAPFNYAANGTNGGLGGETNTFGYRCDGTGTGNCFLYLSNGAFVGMQPYQQGDTVQMAVDAVGLNAWANNNNGNWNDSGAVPGVSGGYSISGLSGTMYPTWQLLADNVIHFQFTVNFGATTFRFTPPTGFSGLSSQPFVGSLMGQACLRVIGDGKRIVREWFAPKRPTIYLPMKPKLILPCLP